VRDAEQLVQETFLRAHVALDRLQPGSNTRAWLHTILQQVRADDWRRRSQPVAPGEHEPAGRQPSREPLARLDVEQGLASLPETYRSAVLLRDIEGFGYQEIADILGIALGTVMSRIHRGRALLRGALAEENS
jgi:RNA polymerase sigma-70 factor (ECF subfamily)